MEGPDVNSSSDSTKERLIVKAKRPPRKRWALRSTIYYDRNFDGLPRSRCSHHVEISADRWGIDVRLSDIEPHSLSGVRQAWRSDPAEIIERRHGNWLERLRVWRLV